MSTELLFLGTGAADWQEYPNDELRFDTDKRIRRQCTVLMGGKYLTDCSPASYEYAKHLKVDTTEITDIFLTHTHSDHLNMESLLGFIKDAKQKIVLHCEKGAVDHIPITVEDASLIEIKPFSVYEDIGSHEVRAVPITANHLVDGSDEITVHYLFEINGKNIFYGCDGGWLPVMSWRYVRQRKLDAAVFDGTVGDDCMDGSMTSHNSLDVVRIMARFLRAKGTIHNNTKVIVSHFARTMHPGIRECEIHLAKDGFIAAYDSMRINID